MATIKVIQNGPYLVQGDDVPAVDWNGASYAIAKRPFALCRCGASTDKPFCDGTHSRTGFKAAEAAVPGSQDKPANSRLALNWAKFEPDELRMHSGDRLPSSGHSRGRLRANCGNSGVSTPTDRC